MILSPLAFAVLIWGSLTAVVAVFGYLLWVILHEAEDWKGFIKS